MRDVAVWVLVGLIAGGLASALLPRSTPAHTAGLLGVGVLGALLGGWACAFVFGAGPPSFLSSVVVGVLGALAAMGLLQRRWGRS
jgi:uncharacterized membrane protein YeaQ/YmgE (transglycosylase-associated protein family)